MTIEEHTGGRRLQEESRGDGVWGGPSMGRVEGPGSADDAPGCAAVDVTAAEVAVAGGCSLNNAGIVLIAWMVWMRQLAAMGPYAYSDAWTH